MEDRQVPLRGEDLSYHVWEKSALVSCREKTPHALAAGEAVLTKTGESGRGWWVFFISLSPRFLLIKRQVLRVCQQGAEMVATFIASSLLLLGDAKEWEASQTPTVRKGAASRSGGTWPEGV